MHISVVFVGVVVPVLADGFVRGKLLQPDIVVVMQSALGIVIAHIPNPGLGKRENYAVILGYEPL